MAVEQGSELIKAVVLLGAGVLAVPLFKRLGLGPVLGYLCAGLLIGPSGLGFFSEAGSVLHIAELGVVMFLFVIGLEMQPRRLWGLRSEIFGLGLAQVVACGLLLTGLGVLLGISVPIAFVGAMGFVLTSTAMVMQLLGDSGSTSTVRGQRIVAILLLEDLAIVPLLAVVAFLSPEGRGGDDASRWVTLGFALTALGGLIAVSKWLLNPLFRVLANAHAREVMTGAALLVVLGAALAMQWGGLSMAMGAFAAGVMLSESTFRHQLEADLEPFRGLLLGLFFMGVGMSLDLALVREDFLGLVGVVLACMAVKAAGIYLVARLFHSTSREAIERSALMAQGGEFAFVLYAAAAETGLIEARVHALLTAAVILSMALTPLLAVALRRLPAEPEQLDMHDVEGVDKLAAVHTLHGNSVLVVGFGRFGQITCQALLARGFDVVVIDRDTDMIRVAAGFGFKVYYGDGTRADVLHSSGAGQARAVLVCSDVKADTLQIVENLKRDFPLTPVLARSYDRQHSIDLIKMGVDFQIRETFESALAFGAAALKQMGVDPSEVDEITEDVRSRDAELLQLQIAGGLQQGRNLRRSNVWTAEPLTKPQRSGKALNEEAADAIEDAEAGN
ncbi:monovalent cation:proton antiporter-2 (CPA2) family protein [soil metagenome]